MAGSVVGSALSALSAGMLERAEKAAAERNERRSQDMSKEETTPLNPNQKDYEDIENPIQMPYTRNSILSTRFSNLWLCLTLALMIFCWISATLQDNRVRLPWWYPWFPNHKS